MSKKREALKDRPPIGFCIEWLLGSKYAVQASEVGTNEMPYLQLDVYFWQIHLRRRQVEATWSFFCFTEKHGDENGYLNPHEIYK